MSNDPRLASGTTGPTGSRAASGVRSFGSPEFVRSLTLSQPEPLRQRTVFRLFLFLTMICSTVLAWQMLTEWEDKHIDSRMSNLRDSLEHRWSEANLGCLAPVRTLCDEIDLQQIASNDDFTRRATELRQAYDVYEGLYWVSPEGVIRARMSADGVMLADVLPYGVDAGLWGQLRRAASGGYPQVGPAYEGSLGRSLVLLYFPLGERGDHGGVAAVLRMGRLVERFADSELRDLLSLDFMRSGQLIYRSGTYLAERDPRFLTTAQLTMLNETWKCQMLPTARFMRQYRSQTPQTVLAVGIVGCLIAGASLLEAMRKRWQYTILERGHLQVIDIISGLTRSIAVSRGEGQKVFMRVLELAQPITESDIVGIYQLSPDRRRLQLICCFGKAELASVVELDDRAVDLLGPAMEGQMLRTSREQRDTATAMRLFSSTALRSGVIAPLLLDRVIGVMVFGSTDGTAWPEGRASLATLWASQTAALMGDEAVHDQMRDALGVQEKLARRREMMLNTLGEMYQAASIEQTLAQIAQLSPTSLGIEACVVALRSKRENELEIVAATGDLGMRYSGTKLAMSPQQLLRLSKPGLVAVIEPHDIYDSGLGKLTEPWLAGLAAVPMTYADGRPIGCLILMSSNRGAFTDDQLDLARVLASRASAAIENGQLNLQIRRDAETRAMLLRELNHRVKNNLAGIVGLLSMSSNMEMPENVRQWLDRVIERIGNIGRAHELFSGGITTVSMSKLVEQVIPSLAVVKPAGVVIIQEMGDSEIPLRTTQAVSLAMVIHELCYNAIVHGLGARGTLTIRAAVADGRSVVLDVIDNGTAGTPAGEEDGGVATMAPPIASTGLGLRLVKGLVGRELRGKFTMRQRSEGGTIVSVEFPLERERAEGEFRQ